MGPQRPRLLAALAAFAAVVVALLAAEPFAIAAAPMPSETGAAATSATGEAPVASAGAPTMETRDAVSPVGPAGADSASTTTRGRVVDLAGTGLTGITIGHEGPAGVAQVAVSGRGGEFACPRPAPGTSLVACDERWETVVAARVDDAASLVVVIAPRVAFAGQVIDSDGRPIEGALLSIDVPTLDEQAPGAPVPQWLAFSDHDGAFSFRAAPGAATARLRTQHPGHRADERPAPAAERFVSIVLAALPVAEPVRGTVFGPDGAPLANARLRMGSAFATSDGNGGFAVNAAREPLGTPLFVFAAGCTPVAVDDPRPRDGRRPPPLVVSLPAAIALHGRLVDAEARPLPKWTVVLVDPTPTDPRRPHTACVEGELGALRVVSDDDGRFTIGGVFARRYTVEAWDRRGERGLRAEIAPADGQVTLVANERETTTLRGVVVDGDGQPVAGVVVGEQRPGTAAEGTLAMRFDQRATTGADGRFELPLRGAALQLVVDGATIVPSCVPLSAATGDAPLRLEVVRRRELRIAGAGLEGVALEPVDEQGRPLQACAATPATIGLPTTARGVVVHRRGVRIGELPLATPGARPEPRRQSGSH